MKTKLLVVAAATLISAGAYMHSGDKPRCLLQMFAKEKPAAKPASAIASTATGKELKEKMKKHLQLKDHDANCHELQCQTK